MADRVTHVQLFADEVIVGQYCTTPGLKPHRHRRLNLNRTMQCRLDNAIAIAKRVYHDLGTPIGSTR